MINIFQIEFGFGLRILLRNTGMTCYYCKYSDFLFNVEGVRYVYVGDMTQFVFQVRN